jgi:predicted  nucleic acid-binding Zn-ribbon protein
MLQRLREFLWFCAGADVAIAREVTIAQPALTAAGACVLTTAALAFLSGSYALYFVFQSWWSAVPFGMLWAGIIFNLDRFMVSSIRKQGGLEDVVMAIPRLVLALVIAAVVVVPLELRLFQDEIDEKLPDYRQGQARRSGELSVGPLDTQLTNVSTRIKDIQEELGRIDVQDKVRMADSEGQRLTRAISDLQRQLSDLDAEYGVVIQHKAEAERMRVEEEKGLGPSRLPGQGREYSALTARVREFDQVAVQLNSSLADLRRQRDGYLVELDNYLGRSRVPQLRADLATLEKQRVELERKRMNVLLNLPGEQSRPASLLTRLTLAQQLAAENPTADWAIAFLSVLIALLELSPIMVRLMSSPSAYDARRDAAEKKEVLDAHFCEQRAQAEYECKLRSLRAAPCP